jgi:hypothetical protein
MIMLNIKFIADNPSSVVVHRQIAERCKLALRDLGCQERQTMDSLGSDRDVRTRRDHALFNLFVKDNFSNT